jgi:hypothetical protein
LGYNITGTGLEAVEEVVKVAAVEEELQEMEMGMETGAP